MQTTHGGPATSSSDSKRAARQLYRDRRQAFVATLSPAEREASDRQLAAMAAPLLDLPEAASPVACYASIGDEIDPQFVERLFAAHGFPRITGRDLSFHLADWKDLIPGPLGIPQPTPDAPIFTPRLLLVPLIAATREGVRLGQGGGYYDRTLARLRAAGLVVAVGLAWECQIAELLPHEPHDQRLDWLLTPQRLVDCAANR